MNSAQYRLQRWKSQWLETVNTDWKVLGSFIQYKCPSKGSDDQKWIHIFHISNSVLLELVVKFSIAYRISYSLFILKIRKVLLPRFIMVGFMLYALFGFCLKSEEVPHLQPPFLLSFFILLERRISNSQAEYEMLYLSQVNYNVKCWCDASKHKVQNKPRFLHLDG